MADNIINRFNDLEKRDKTCESIAKSILNLKTLEERGLDRYDFSSQHVVGIRLALQTAYEAGANTMREAFDQNDKLASRMMIALLIIGVCCGFGLGVALPLLW